MIEKLDKSFYKIRDKIVNGTKITEYEICPTILDKINEVIDHLNKQEEKVGKAYHE